MSLPRRVAVTGGAGFIGSHVVEALAEAGVRVLVIDDCSHACGAAPPAGVELCQTDAGSTRAASALVQFRPDAVLHLAAKGGVAAALRDPAAHLRAVVGSTIAVYAAACDAGARVIVSASSGGAVYGDARELPASEELAPAPRSAYGASKLAEEAYLGSFGRLRGVRTLALRLGNVYGPRQDGEGEAGVIAITCSRLAAERPPVLFGDGGQTRDFVYVKDVAAACLAALGSDEAGAINVGSGRETSVGEVVERLAALHDGGLTVERRPGRPGEVRRSCLDAARARRLLGWEAATPLPDGLRSTLVSFLDAHAQSGSARGG